MSDLQIEQGLWLCPEGGAFWASEATLFVADVHLGKTVTFREGGCPVPEGPTEEGLERIGALVDRLSADRVVVLGDLWHDERVHAEATARPFEAWRAARRDLEFWLVPGNHDRRFHALAQSLALEIVPAGSQFGPFLLFHRPDDCPSREALALAGHVHPCFRLEQGGVSHRLPCFWQVGGCLVLPAFGPFTGGFNVDRDEDSRIFVTTGESVLEVRHSDRRPFFARR
ncbi:MAG: ligase-associated DNA damage response endonuclease PdeM [Fimbriimonadaceae bacterium]|nr:ligase-associated DNA damage response endonuclease PdeM [Fimbriimonadaceae bacterium]QYK55589.1 MAG: ligase-associated DNA damage response endonuclease PdeM [Fimbriimonadaceae bacterium]